MAVAKMTKVTVFYHRSRRDAVVATLERLGTVQVLDAFQVTEIGDRRAAREDEAKLQSQVDEVAYALRYLQASCPQKRGLMASFLSSKEQLTPAEYAQAIEGVDARSIYQMCFADEVRLNEIRARRLQLDAQIELLTPWVQLPMRVETIHDTDHARVAAISVSQTTVEGLRSALAGKALCDAVSTDKRLAYAVVAYLKEESAEIEAALAAAQAKTVQFGDLRGRSRDIIAAATAELAELDSVTAEIRQRAEGFAEYRLSLMAIHDRLVNELRRAQLQAQFTGTGQVDVVTGWVKEREVERLKSALWQCGEVEVFTESPGPEDNVPVALENHPLLEPFEVVTNLYGYPKYGEVDPTPMLAPFFFVFFGLALTDAGYGLLLIALGWLAIKKLGIPRSGTKLIRLLMLAGVSTTVLGALTGSWFGDMPRLLPGFMSGVSQAVRSITLVDPLSDPITVLLIALGLGVVQVWTGVCIKVVITIREGRTLDAVFDHGSWLLLLPGAVLFGAGGPALAPIGQVIALAGAAGVVIGGMRRQRHWLLKPFSGLYSLYGMINYVGDILSYARLLALGLATAVIGTVVNQIAQLIGAMPWIGWLLALCMIVGGHIFNLLVNTLGSFVHSGRLQFVEFFTKFFEGGGRPFRPYRWEGSFVNVEGDVSLAEATVPAAQAAVNELGGM